MVTGKPIRLRKRDNSQSDLTECFGTVHDVLGECAGWWVTMTDHAASDDDAGDAVATCNYYYDSSISGDGARNALVADNPLKRMTTMR